MIRPWYRSRLFWLGLPGLVFLVWLWLAKAEQLLFVSYDAITGPTERTVQSIGASDGAIYHETEKYYFDGHRPPGFNWSPLQESGAGLGPDDSVTYFPRRPFGIRRTSVSPEPFYAEINYTEIRQIWLAWWVAIAAYTAVWLGALACWQRRKARLSRRAAAELPGS